MPPSTEVAVSCKLLQATGETTVSILWTWSVTGSTASNVGYHSSWSSECVADQTSPVRKALSVRS